MFRSLEEIKNQHKGYKNSPNRRFNYNRNYRKMTNLQKRKLHQVQNPKWPQQSKPT